MPNSHFSLFKTFVDRERHVAMVLNPKVLTTFTRRFLSEGFAEFHGRADPSEGRYRLVKNARRFPMARLRDYWHFRNHHSDYAIYAFVRNPYARVFSGWKDKFYDGHKGSEDGRLAGYPRSMRRGELKAARAFCAAHGLEGAVEGTLVPFGSFVPYFSAQQPGQRNQHWDLQTLVLQQPEFKLAGAFLMESQLEEAIKTIARVLEFDEDWAVSRLKKKENVSSNWPGDHPMTEGVAEQVYKACKPDFDVFGYRKDSYTSLW
ncbi:sulfotransferase family protein [Lentibacter algarum]|uniref:sulfotransferase family 2 domain-containing protein n=1 Tax=Lentibacter algarum TaxID=576131 RepID=UPI001C071358|nr:sulfotransferase family 2 domain-containing protein [Lentibacter algarum]MBU2982044.1 sulfotransferase family protein [Lentibacter algarum]